jgi:adenylate cyclase
LITRLSNLSLIQVRPTSAIVKYAGPGFDPLAAGRALQVDAVLDGSIRHAGERLRVTVQLVSVEHDTPLWAEKFDEQFTDIFAVEDHRRTGG